MKLISNWREFHKLWSVRLNLIGTAIMTAFMAWPSLALDLWLMMPSEVKDFLPPRLVPLLALAFFLAATVARLIKQKLDGE